MNLSAVGFFQATNHAQRGRLAAAARAEQREELSFGDLKIDVIDRNHARRRFCRVLDAPEAHGWVSSNKVFATRRGYRP